jgi:hypothetical protein
MKTEDPIGQNKIAHSPPSRTVYRRRISILRAALVALITAVALIFFILWYRAYPQRLDCLRMAQRLTVALEEYREKNKSLPSLLEVLPIKTGRYNMEHFTYYFTGLGGPAVLPDRTLVAYCANPHRALFIQPWRSVILFEKGRITQTTLPENQFQILRSKQRPPEKY